MNSNISLVTPAYARHCAVHQQPNDKQVVAALGVSPSRGSGQTASLSLPRGLVQSMEYPGGPMREVPHKLSWKDWEGGGSGRGKGRSEAWKKGPTGMFCKQTAGPRRAGLGGGGQETASLNIY